MLVQIITENGQKKIIPLTADAGAGNPVGTVIVVCSNQIPSNYLPLGTQYDTSLYPILYALLGTDTTPTASALGLPTLTSGQYAIKATSGLSENAQDNVLAQLNEERSYSTSEVNTGKKWIDGKPIYRKVIEPSTQIGNYSNAWTAIGESLPNADMIVKSTSIRADTDNNDIISALNIRLNKTTKQLSYWLTQDGKSGYYKIILEYTKTTD